MIILCNCVKWVEGKKIGILGFRLSSARTACDLGMIDSQLQRQVLPPSPHLHFPRMVVWFVGMVGIAYVSVLGHLVLVQNLSLSSHVTLDTCFLFVCF